MQSDAAGGTGREPDGIDPTAAARGHARLMAALASVGALTLTVGLVTMLPADSRPPFWAIVAFIAVVLLLASVGLYGLALLAGTAADRARFFASRGFLLVLAALAGIAVSLGIKLFVPAPVEAVFVQFSDRAGRVQLEYCPSLPGSFEAKATAADIRGTSTVVPVLVSGDVCGNTDFTDGVWLHLKRSSVTIAVE